MVTARGFCKMLQIVFLKRADNRGASDSGKTKVRTSLKASDIWKKDQDQCGGFRMPRNPPIAFLL